jgi:hypothetical protein
MFLYKQWEIFCRELNNNGIHSVTAASLLNENVNKEEFLVLKHDVETNPSKALRLAEIENRYFHKGSYYVQAYLLHDEKNIEVLKKIRDLGHEVSYHHDVMDSNKGNMEKARLEFLRYKELFEQNGFTISTVCQHGNPVIERQGYTSNRDFFRDNGIQNEFSSVAEIMVNYKDKLKVNYKYISDAGYGWKVIFDPENNDIYDSNDKNIPINDLKDVITYLKKNRCVIISTHPHRWHSNKYNALLKDSIFKIIKNIAKLLLKIPGMKKVMGKFYFLAKKI